MYTPPNTKTLKDLDTQQIRCALQGPSGTGKTFGGLTFPNVDVLNFDNNLQAHKNREDVKDIPFWNDQFVDSLVPRTKGPNGTVHPTARPNRRDALLKWLREHGPKYEPGQTLFLDSWTTAQDGFDQQQKLEPAYTQSGKIDDFDFWEQKIYWSRDILELLKSLRCHVVVSFHEQFLTDADGKVLFGKIQPLMQGKFVNKLGLYFTEWYRCLAIGVGQENPLTKQKATSTTYLWQTRSDLATNCKSRMINCPDFITPGFSSIKY